jgi:hypothetical protein
MSRGRLKLGSRGGELRIVLRFGSKAIIRYVAMHRPILVMSTAEAHLLTVSGDRDQQRR